MKRRSRRSDSVGIEIAPLIDIVFILLIFFVVTSTFIKESALELVLPSAVSAMDPPVSQPIEISVSADNEIRIGDVLFDAPSVGLLTSHLSAFVKDVGKSQLVVRADARSRHETVVLALDAANQLGIAQVNIVTLKADE